MPGTRQQAHDLIDRMAPGQVAAVVGLLEIMLDPFAGALADASFDDEPIDAEEAAQVALSREAFARGEMTSNDAILAEFGLTQDDFRRMGGTPLPQRPEPILHAGDLDR